MATIKDKDLEGQKAAINPNPTEEQVQEQPSDSAAQQFQSADDFDRYFTNMQMKEAALERDREEERIRRQAGARSLADIGAVFTDMIRASQGAVVSPRSVDEHYNRLDDRQKAVVDGYRARMDVLFKQQQERARQKEEDARRARELEEGRQHDKDMLNLRLAAQAEADERNKAFQAEQGRLNRANQYAIHNGSGSRRPEDEYFIDFGDVNGSHVTKDYENNTKEGSNVFAAIYNYLHDKVGFIPDLEDKDGNVIMVKDKRTRDEMVRQYLNAAMQDPKHRAAIYKIVYGNDMPGYVVSEKPMVTGQQESSYANYGILPGVQHAQKPQSAAVQKPKTSSSSWY